MSIYDTGRHGDYSEATEAGQPTVRASGIDAWVPEVSDQVDNPSHYARFKDRFGVEVWDVLDFLYPDNPNMWNAGKYYFRGLHKNSFQDDMGKLKQYIDRELKA